MRAGRVVADDEDDYDKKEEEQIEDGTADPEEGLTIDAVPLDDDELDASPRSDYQGLGYDSGSEWEGEGLAMASMRLEQIAPLPSAPRQEQGGWTGAIKCIAQSFQMSTAIPSRSVRTAWIYDPRIRHLTDKRDQPNRDLQMQRPLCAQVIVNGEVAYALFDSGCTTDSISPTFAYIAMADRIQLDEQVGLQLGARGSRTKISYGARANVQVGPVNDYYYMDVVDIDRYDLILGTPFFSKYDVVLDFKNRTIVINGDPVPVYNDVDEAEAVKARVDRHRLRLSDRVKNAPRMAAART